MYVILIGLATAECVPDATLDPCVSCPGPCDDRTCEIASLQGVVHSMAAAATSLFICSDVGAKAALTRVTFDGSIDDVGEMDGQCVAVAVEGSFAYFGVAHPEAGGVFRSDLSGQGLSRLLGVRDLRGLSVQDGEVVFTRDGISTPLVLDAGGHETAQSRWEQAEVTATQVAHLSNGHILWNLPETREVMLTSADGQEGGPVFNAPAGIEAEAPFVLARVGSDGIFVDGGDLWAIGLSNRPLRRVASGLRQPRSVVAAGTDAIVAEVDAVRAYPLHGGAVNELAPFHASVIATSGTRVFAAVGPSLIEIRR
ncbi:MAG: hypothetical protein IPM79_01620 [Polyangiaceae bacterium]|nr:hypothetical protein [Polyangiaceae bacterium]MBK8936371.1 hypothetical protein [Polyangiaceae bacterium]